MVIASALEFPGVKRKHVVKKVIWMLVLTRQKDESIMIGDNIKITVVSVRNGGIHDDQVCLGITAPKRISIHREEVYEAIQRKKAEKRAAAGKKSSK